MAATASFVYPRVEPRSIRLLHLEAGQHDDPIEVSLNSVSLDSNPIYEAISYCWGDQNSRQDVSCMGTTMSITTSLWGALREFRRSDVHRILWVDGICINQDDEIDKTCQVRLMHEIYAKATMVLAWLGPMDEAGLLSRISTSLQRLHEFLARFETALRPEAQRTLISDSAKPCGEKGPSSMLQDDWSAISELLGRPWFTRKWVVQEVAMAQEVRLHIGGGVQLPWLDLTTLAGKLSRSGAQTLIVERMRPEESKAFASGQDHINVMHAVTHARLVGRGTLLDAVMRTSGFFCSDPRDHVYGLLSCASDGPSLEPDYTLSIDDTFKRFAQAMLKEGKSLKVLSLELHKLDRAEPCDTRNRTKLPSWVPDLHRPATAPFLSADTLFINGCDAHGPYHAGGLQKPVLSFSDDGNSLHCQGIVVDEIKGSVPSLYEMVVEEMPELFETHSKLSLPFDPSPEGRFRRAQRWLRACYDLTHSQASELNKTSRGRALSCALLCDQGTSAGGKESEEMVNATFEYTEDIVLLDDTIPLAERFEEIPQESPMVPKLWFTVEHTIARRGAWRKFSVTTAGRLGQMPLGTRKGDFVCILIGGEVPFVIRPIGPGSVKYHLVGNCFLNGAMNGEMIVENEHATREIVLV